MTVILSVDEARSLAERCLQTAGYSAADSAIIADHLIDCELRGVSSGGLPRLLSVLERLRDTPQPAGEITLLRENAVSASFDGGDQVGYLVGHKAAMVAIAKAKEAGVGVAGAKNTWMTGMFSYYMEMATREGLVAMAAGSSVQAVAPFGGTEPRFGTNPIAFGFPSDDGPVIWDIGTSNVDHAKVSVCMRLGQPLREGLAFDEHGQPTTDPTAALSGAYTVWGGHKGSGLTVVIQLLGMMTGADAAPVGMSGCGFVIVVIDPEIFTPADDFRRRVAAYAESIRTSRPVDPAKPVRVPFDRSAATRAARLRENRVEVFDVVYKTLREAADSPLAPSTAAPVDRWRAPQAQPAQPPSRPG
jgi:LDH2 family malate/lactate/ureidoglycolate dehydrogenase